jgi:uncharacterized protein (TIGR02996 family)
MQQVFLDAIRANPDDDVSRLVYADWLDEHGDAARADFIRTQVRLARLDEDDPARPELEQRERDLIAAHERGWLACLPEGVDWSYRGGLIDQLEFGRAVELDGLTERDGLAELLRQHPVRELSFGFVSGLGCLSQPGLAEFVTGLNFRARLEREHATAIARLLQSKALVRLTSLKLGGPFLDDDFLGALASSPVLPQLHTLHLIDSSASPSTVADLFRSWRLPRLSELWLGDRCGSGELLSVLTEAEHAERWARLGLIGPTPPSAGDVMRLERCSNLRELRLSELRAPLPALPALERLGLEEDGASSLRMLIHSECLDRLRRLDLYFQFRPEDRHADDLGAVLNCLGQPALHLELGGGGPELLRALLGRQHAGLAHLRGLSFRAPLASATGRALAECPLLTGLTDFTTQNSHEGQTTLVPVLRNPALRGLVRLYLDYSGLEVLDFTRVLTEAPPFERLRELGLSGDRDYRPLDDRVPTLLARWPGLGRLNRLVFGANPLEDAGATALLGSPHLHPALRLTLRLGPASPLRSAFRERLGHRFRG